MRLRTVAAVAHSATRDEPRGRSRLVHVRGVEIEPPAISPNVADEVLKLAGTVAHTSDRTFAPLASFATGIAVGELRAAGQLRSDRETAALVAQFRTELEASIERQPPAGLAIKATTNLSSLPISPWAGLGVLAAWSAGALIIGGLLLYLRDA